MPRVGVVPPETMGLRAAGPSGSFCRQGAGGSVDLKLDHRTEGQLTIVEVEEIEDRRLRALVYVETESQKGILVGKRGAMVREIGTRARPEVEALVGRPLFLELTVKVRPKWRRDPLMLERLGL